MNNKVNETIESVFGDVDSMFSNCDGPVKTKAITIWLPEDKALKFEQIQAKSKRRFGKKLKEVVIRSIDLINLDAV